MDLVYDLTGFIITGNTEEERNEIFKAENTLTLDELPNE